MKQLIYVLVFLSSTISIAQNYQLLPPEERAYLFHIVKKSPILEMNLGRYVEYVGPEIKHPNGEPIFDSIEEYMINHPEALVIREHEIAKSPKGLLAEAANKMAIWELNKALLAREEKEDSHYKEQYDRFEELLIAFLPPAAFKSKKDSVFIHQKIYNVLSPNLSLDEKKSMLQNMRFLDINGAWQVLNAQANAINQYVERRSEEIYKALGGEADVYRNVLVAAGDGSSTTGLLEEREKDERGRWNRGLPRAIGLFPYQIGIEEEQITKKRKEQVIEPARVTKNQFMTAGNNRLTNLHFDVWGYNSEKQTTVIIEKSGKIYRLFGSGETRFLSPDSAFANGTTFQAIINDLEFNKIGKLTDRIFGRRGYDHWIAYNEKKKDAVEMKIIKKEKEYSDLGYQAITTDRRASREVRKHKKKSTVLTDYQPTTNSQKGKRRKLQNEIVGLYGRFEAYKKKIKDLQTEKTEALELLEEYQLKLELYKRAFGEFAMPFEEEEGLYMFSDSTTFDIRTQEFVFPASYDTVPFEVRLLAIPESCLSKNADEVMLHINVLDATPKYSARVQIQATDLFASDQFNLSDSLLSESDSVSIRVFLESLLNKDLDFEIVARGNGVGYWDGVRVRKDDAQKELDQYPGANKDQQSNAKLSEDFSRLRYTEILAHIDRNIVLEVNSYTDPVKSNLSIKDEDLLAQQSKNGWSNNQMLSALRTAALLRKLKEELNVKAGKYFERSEAKIIIDRLNKEISKTKIAVGESSIKVKL